MTTLSEQLQRIAEADGAAAKFAEIALRDGPVRSRLEAAIAALSRERGPDKTICPSDAARAIGGENWRDLMDDARGAARDLAREGTVEITQKGQVIDPDATWRGPIRIRATS